MALHKDQTTKIHVMKLSDGTVQTFDTEEWILVLHTANAYQEDGTLVLEAQTFENKDNNPFDSISFDKINNANKFLEHDFSSKFKKMSFNLIDGTFKLKNYMGVDNGIIDLPMFNPKYSGIKNCFTYLIHEWGATTIDENYSFPIHKYDSC